MSDLQTAVRETLGGDVPLKALLTGGVYDSGKLGQLGVRPEASNIYDGRVMKPCAVFRWRAAAGLRPPYATQKHTFEIFFFEDGSDARIKDAIGLAKKLLHRAQIVVDDRGVWWVNWVSDSSEFKASDLGGASTLISRYEAIYLRE